jgi:hypothetical protein
VTASGAACAAGFHVEPRQNLRETMNSTPKKNARFAAILCACSCALALAQSPVIAADAAMLNASELKWGDAPPQLPKGAKLAVLYGDPGKEGPFTLRLKIPGGYKIAPHWHSNDENLTVISGAFYLGMGDKMEAKSAHMLKAGGYHYLPGKQHHFAFSKAPTIVQVSGSGPFDITYIDPADDPSKGK